MIVSKRTLSKLLTGVLLLSMGSACALPSPTLSEKGVVQTEIKESSPVRITNVTVRRVDGMMVVRGEAVFPIWHWFGKFTGHIDIDVVAPGSDVLKKRNLSLIRKRIPRKRGRKAVFVSNFEFDPTKGTIVQVSYHRGVSKTHE